MLLDTPILDQFRDDIQRFLLNEGSIPAFISWVTMSFHQARETAPTNNTTALVQSHLIARRRSHEDEDTHSVQIEVVPSGGQRARSNVVEVDIEDDEDMMGEEEEGEEVEEEEEEDLDDISRRRRHRDYSDEDEDGQEPYDEDEEDEESEEEDDDVVTIED